MFLKKKLIWYVKLPSNVSLMENRCDSQDFSDKFDVFEELPIIYCIKIKVYVINNITSKQ